MNRREVGRLFAASAASAALPGLARAAAPMPRAFAPGFRWGAATSAYQIEGALDEDGRGRSIWDSFAARPGRIADGSSAATACDSYHRFAQDRALLAGLGANAYRLSFAWPRFFPQGRGTVNPAAISHYSQVIDDLLASGIEPHVTLFHWDLPEALAGGWQSRDTAKAFADYAGTVATHFADRVRHFSTLNEVRSFVDLGYGSGVHAPGLTLAKPALAQVRHNALLAHGLGVGAIRANGRVDTQVGIAENVIAVVPAIEDEATIALARRAFRDINAVYIVPVMEGRYPEPEIARFGEVMPRGESGDMAAIGAPLDFVSLNCYTGLYVRAAQNALGYAMMDEGLPTMGLPWLRVLPEAIYWQVRMVAEMWSPKAIYIAENGTVAPDVPNAGGRVSDYQRVMYLRNYLGAAQRAAAEGYPLAGYFVWSLLDNFEWAEGYRSRFGLHYVDFASQERRPKLSAQWYREVIAANAVL